MHYKNMLDNINTQRSILLNDLNNLHIFNGGPLNIKKGDVHQTYIGNEIKSILDIIAQKIKDNIYNHNLIDIMNPKKIMLTFDQCIELCSETECMIIFNKYVEGVFYGDIADEYLTEYLISIFDDFILFFVCL